MNYYRFTKSPVLAEQEISRLNELYRFEMEFYSQGSLVIGADEVGRGALAGPVTVGACILPPEPQVEWLNDSKALTKLRRKKVAEALIELGARFEIAHIEPAIIDELGIVQALRQAFTAAVTTIQLENTVIVLDGTPIGLQLNERYVVKGDSRIAAIAAASVLAKQSRDQLMTEFDELYPEYSFGSNKGYGSASHMQALREHGLSPVHRKSFCSQILAPTLF